MGDIFDFWFEYKSVIPKGFVRLLGKLAEITDNGIPVHVFTGNHDIWAFNYLHKEVGIILHRKPEILDFTGKKFYLAHGDGLGPGDKGYKLLKKVFSNPFNQLLFRWLHPDIGAGLALYFSRKSRIANMVKEGRHEYMNTIEHEMLYHYSKSILEKDAGIDFFVFGHRHLPVVLMLNKRTKLVILGDWLTNFTYAEFDGRDLELKYFNL